MTAAAADAIEVLPHDDDTVVLRQTRASHVEAPFLFLLLGSRRAALVDTGAVPDPTAFPLRAVVDRLIARWLAEHPHDGYGLVVLHSHPHTDHVAADGQFAGRPDTVVVGHDLAAVDRFLGFDDAGRALLDLGGRVLEVVRAPGHHPAAIALVDSGTGWLLTGDTVYPGRLVIDDDLAFAATLDRLVALARARRATAVVGCHIEMSPTPGVDLPEGVTGHPDEAPLPMTLEQRADVRDAAHAVVGLPGRHVHDDFVLVNRTP